MAAIAPLDCKPTHSKCPSCHAVITTSTLNKPGTIAYFFGALICLLGGSCGCCLIPCCINDCMDVHHTCPKCKTYLGRYTK